MAMKGNFSNLGIQNWEAKIVDWNELYTWKSKTNKVKLESEVFTLKSNLSESYISLKKIGCK